VEFPRWGPLVDWSMMPNRQKENLQHALALNGIVVSCVLERWSAFERLRFSIVSSIVWFNRALSNLRTVNQSRADLLCRRCFNRETNAAKNKRQLRLAMYICLLLGWKSDQSYRWHVGRSKASDGRHSIGAMGEVTIWIRILRRTHYSITYWSFSELRLNVFALGLSSRLFRVNGTLFLRSRGLFTSLNVQRTVDARSCSVSRLSTARIS
jgi:hypothetical protein